MQEQILKQPRSTSDSIPTISWHVRLVDVQAKPEKPLDSRYRLGTLIMEEEWYAEQTIIWHNGSKGDKLEKARGCQLGMTQMVHQAQPPGGSIMRRRLRQLLVLDPDEIDPDVDTL